MKLFFRKYGEGTPLLILHGLFGQSDNWNTLAKKYSENGFAVYAIDQRNHGLSPKSDEWNYFRMAEDLMELIESENLKNPVVMGHSMGGKTCMFFEYQFPNIASKLIISDIAPRKYMSKNTEVLQALNGVDLIGLTSRKDAENQLTASGLDFGTRQFLLKNLYREENNDNSKQLFDWRFNLAVITRDFEKISTEVPFYTSETPTLFLRGEFSDYINSEDENEIKNRFRNSEMIKINGAGHWIHAEKPEEYFNCTLSFLKK